MKKIASVLVISLLLVPKYSLMAQDRTQLGLDIAKAQENNRDKLMNYSWQRSSKVYRDGVEKTHNLVKVWFNSEGKMDMSVLNSESTVKQKRGVRGRVQQGEGQNLTDLLEQSVKMSIKYIYLSKGNWIDLMDREGVMIVMDELKIDISAKDVLIKSDKAHYIIDSNTKLIKSIKLTSLVDDKSFTSSIDFKTTSDGTNHPDYMTINIPAESLKITAENIDYVKQQ